ncbi:MAG: PIG-L family deacetylase [Candidatus Bathyarchaeia archaeon]
MVNSRMIVFAPHPDDETLACGGTMLRKIQEGFDVHVVVMTDGRHSHDVTLGLAEPSPETIAEIRATEFSEATRVLGVNLSNLLLLGFEDGKLREQMSEARERTVRILREVRPVEIYVPYRDDANEDHRTTYEIVAGSVREADLLPKMYEYSVWNGKIPRPGLKVFVMDIHGELGRKMEAISKYKSQISTCFPKQEKAVLSEEFVNMFRSESEVFYTKQ